MRKLLQACSKALKRSIETAYFVAQFRGLFVPGRSPILLASGQIGHLLIDCPAERIKLLARGRSGKGGPVKGQLRSSFHLKSYSVAEFVRHAILRRRPHRPVRRP